MPVIEVMDIPEFQDRSILITNTLEGPHIPGDPLATEFLVENEEDLRAKVREGARFRFKWEDGNTYELPIKSMYIRDVEDVDILGLPRTFRVALIELCIFENDIERYKVV